MHACMYVCMYDVGQNNQIPFTHYLAINRLYLLMQKYDDSREDYSGERFSELGVMPRGTDGPPASRHVCRSV